MPKLIETDGRRIKAAATEAGMSLRDLAKSISVADATVYAYVSGALKPSRFRITEIAKATNKPVEFFSMRRPGAEAKLQLDLVDAHLSGPDLEAAGRLLSEHLQTLDPAQRGPALLKLGNTLLLRGSYHEAILKLTEAKEVSLAVREKHTAGRASQSLGFCLANIGSLSRAEKVFRDAASLLDPADKWKAQLALAVVAERQGHFDEALELVEQVETAADALSARLHAFGVKSNILFSRTDYGCSFKCEQNALMLAEQTGISEQLCERLISLALVCLYMGDNCGKISLAQANVAARITKDLARKAYLDTVRSMYALSWGMVDQAVELAHSALELSISGAYRRAELGATLRLAEAAVFTQRYREAYEHALKAKSLAAGYGYASEREYAELLMALMLGIEGSIGKASVLLQEINGRGCLSEMPVYRYFYEAATQLAKGLPWDGGTALIINVRQANVAYLPGFTKSNEQPGEAELPSLIG